MSGRRTCWFVLLPGWILKFEEKGSIGSLPFVRFHSVSFRRVPSFVRDTMWIEPSHANNDINISIDDNLHEPSSLFLLILFLRLNKLLPKYIKVKYNREFSSKESTNRRMISWCKKFDQNQLKSEANAFKELEDWFSKEDDDCQKKFCTFYIEQWNSTTVYFVSLNFIPWSDDESSTLKVARVLTNTSRSLIKSLDRRENKAIKIGSHDIQTPPENPSKVTSLLGVDFNEHLVNDVLDDMVIELGWRTLEHSTNDITWQNTIDSRNLRIKCKFVIIEHT